MVVVAIVVMVGVGEAAVVVIEGAADVVKVVVTFVDAVSGGGIFKKSRYFYPPEVH